MDGGKIKPDADAQQELRAPLRRFDAGESDKRNAFFVHTLISRPSSNISQTPGSIHVLMFAPQF